MGQAAQGSVGVPVWVTGTLSKGHGLVMRLSRPSLMVGIGVLEGLFHDSMPTNELMFEEVLKEDSY